MASIKISPLFLFLLLLGVLVISALFGNLFKIKEGLVSYQQSLLHNQSTTIPTYSPTNQVVKLTDNLYFDGMNANLIEVDSSTYTNAVDSTGSTITKTIVTPRMNSSQSSVFVTGNTTVNQNTNLSVNTSVTSSYNSFVYNSQCPNTDNYIVFYMPWKTNTYLHIINLKNKTHVSSHIFGTTTSTGSTNSFNYDFLYPSSAQTIGNYVADNNSSNNTLVAEPLYGASKLYQISQYVKFDIKNGNLVINTAVAGTGNNTNPTILVIDRYGNPTQNFTKTNIDTVGTFQPYVKIDSLGQNAIIYLPKDDTTVIAIIGYDSNNKLVLKNVCRFTSTGIDNAPVTPPATCGTASPPAPTKDDSASEYFKWYWYWKNNGNSTDHYSDDYILKTQVVPPVCPTCPACPKAGACTNCGGNGGSGTLTHDGKGVINNTVDGIESVANNTVNAAAGLIGNVSKDVTGLAGEVVGDIASLGRGSGNYNRGEDSGNKNVMNGVQGAYKSPYGPTYGKGTQHMDQYSYYGSLPTKGDSNFMPVTADFSAFGR